MPNEAPVHIIIDQTKRILKLTQFDFLEQKIKSCGRGKQTIS